MSGDCDVNRPDYQICNLSGTVFTVPSNYVQLTTIGTGSFGQVCSAFDRSTGGKVAIKKLLKPFQTHIHARRTFREIMLLKHMNHENVIGLTDVFSNSVDFENFNDIYLVTQLLGSDLSTVIKSQMLMMEHIRFLIYQVLRGLKFVHSSGVVHRDLKPSNLVVNDTCELKIVDFGLARSADQIMTGYVATRWYRAPEIMLSWKEYDKAVDIWSVGCIMAEMLTGKPLFPGTDHVSQLSLIIRVIGTPNEAEIEAIKNETARTYVHSLPRRNGMSFTALFPQVDMAAIDLLQRMLLFEPSRRITAAEALQHPFVSEFHDSDDEPDGLPFVDEFDGDNDLSIDDWRTVIFKTISELRPVGLLNSPCQSGNDNCTTLIDDIALVDINSD